MVDIKWRVLLGEDVLKIVRLVTRRLTGRLPATQRKCNRHAEHQMKKHKVLEKCHGTCQRVNKARVSDLDKKLLNSLDKIKADVCIASEKHCCKLTMGEADFPYRLHASN